jgi:protein-tyrosine phosphatase
MTRILFVCMGNICRSPIVESVARVELARVGMAAHVESAGTENYHVGERADPRAIAIAQAHCYPLAGHRARQLQSADFHSFDHVLAMDRVNLRAMQSFRPRLLIRDESRFQSTESIPHPCPPPQGRENGGHSNYLSAGSMDGVEPVLFLGDADVADPYYGTDEDFERVVVLARDGVSKWIGRLRELRAMGG